MKNKIVLPIIILAVSGAAVFSAVNLAYAQSNNSNAVSGLAQAIAQKFNLDATQVQNVINTFRTSNHSNRVQTLSSRLDVLVQQGKITSEQKQTIIDEVNKLMSEKQTSMMTRITEFKTWAQSQGIDPNLIPVFRGRHMGWQKKTMFK